MKFSISYFFFIVVIFQLLFISAFLFTHKRGKPISNKLLATFFLSIGLNLVDSLLQLTGFYTNHSRIAFWGSCLPLLFGPLLLLYVQSIVYNDFLLDKKRWIHMLPFVIFFLVTETTYLTRSNEFRESFLNNLMAREVPPYLQWVAGLIFLQFVIYATYSLRLISQYQKEISNKYSNPSTNVSSLSTAIIFFIALMIITTFNQFAAATTLSKYYFAIFAVILFLIFVFINRILFKALGHTEVFSGMDEKFPTDHGSGAGLAEDEKKKIVSRLQQHMQSSKPFLDGELTLEQLAIQLSLRTKVLSHVINDSLQQNFFDFVNRYRIEEAKKILATSPDKKITVLEVLYKVGFNSKSSFNTLFKKYTGLTPTAFRNGLPQ